MKEMGSCWEKSGGEACTNRFRLVKREEISPFEDFTFSAGEAALYPRTHKLACNLRPIMAG